MSQTNPQPTLTHHAMLVAWGQHAQAIGLIEAVEAVPLHQKTYIHRPQTKVLEFLVAILAGLPHLKDISQAPHPLDMDEAVARAWNQPAWADHSGVSRALHALTMDEALQIVQALETISQPFLDREVMLALRDQGFVVYDGDLTGRAVSNSSTTYPNVAYGHMSDVLQLGYQAAMVSVHSPTYGRLWLSVRPHPGDTVSCTQAEDMVLTAEARTGVRPLRRTDLLCQRIQALTTEKEKATARLQQAQKALERASTKLGETWQQIQSWQRAVTGYEAAYQKRQRPERPHSRLAQARAHLAVYQQRQGRQGKGVARAQQRVVQQEAKVAQLQAEEVLLQERLARFEQENATNANPIRAIFRLDAGFGTRENVALLIEMGYEVYTKPYSRWLTPGLRRRISPETTWTQVGTNAEMVAWPSMQIAKFPYPLDVALERFQTGETPHYSGLIHYGDDPVTTNLPGWFRRYNERQTIEAGIKEGKQVFQMHHLKVQSEGALFLQEQFAAFAADFVRWAAHYLAEQDQQMTEYGQEKAQPSVKTLVQVAAHTSAWVDWQADGCLLRFTEHSVYAGRTLQARDWAFQPSLPVFKSCVFAPI